MPETKSPEELRDARLVEKRFEELLYRQVGFERFDPERAFLLSGLTYVAIHGPYVLLGFSAQTAADKFFATALKASL